MRLSQRVSADIAGVLLSVALVFACVGSAGAARVPASELVSKGEPVYFSGDSFSYDSKTGIVTGTGNVEIVQDDNTIRGDKVTVNLPNKVADVEGHVVVSTKGAKVEGTSGQYNFENQSGVFHQAHGYVEPWYIASDEIDRETSGQYAATRGTMTTCNKQHPHYRLQAGTITLIPQERVTARNLTLFADSVPIFYLPYYSQNLGPSAVAPLEFDVGQQSDLGVFMRLGYHLDMSKQVSLTPYVRAFTKSGVGPGLEGRLRLFEGKGTGWFDTFYIHDLNTENTDDPGIPEDRGTAYAFYRQELPHDFTLRLRGEYNSDIDFLKTYYWDKYSEREVPKSYVNLERTGEHSVVSFLAEPRTVDYIQAVERLPQLRLDLLEQRVGDTGFFVSAENMASNLDIDPEGPHSARNFSETRLAYPLRLLNAVTFVPFVEGDATYYSDTLDDGAQYRLSFDPGMVAQTHVQREFNSPFPQYYTAFRHLMVPTVTYNYRPTPTVEPDELPQFDQIDTFGRENLVDVEIRNYLQAKKPDGTRVELLEYRVDTQFDFEDPDHTLVQVENDLWIRPVSNWEVVLKSLNDYREATRTDTVNALIRYAKPDALKAYGGVIYEDTRIAPANTQLVYSFSKAFGPLWRAGFEQRYDFSINKLSYQEYWIWRDLHCLEMLLSVLDRREATSFMVLLNISAFPLSRIKHKTAIAPLEENHPWPTHW